MHTGFVWTRCFCLCNSDFLYRIFHGRSQAAEFLFLCFAVRGYGHDKPLQGLRRYFHTVVIYWGPISGTSGIYMSSYLGNVATLPLLCLGCQIVAVVFNCMLQSLATLLLIKELGTYTWIFEIGRIWLK